MGSSSLSKGGVKAPWAKHLRMEVREVNKRSRRAGKEHIKDALKADEDEDKKKGKVLKEENQLISNFIHNILERNYKDAHKYLEQIVQHKVVNKMRECKSDTLF